MSTDFIDRNPMLKKPVLLVLATCARLGEPGRAALEGEAQKAWDSSFTQTPAAIVDALVREGLLLQQITVDGSAYEGTLEDAYRDDAVADDAEVDALVGVTEAGASALRDHAPETTMAALMGARPEYRVVFEAVLAACSADGGMGLPSLEDVIEGAIAQHGVCASDGSRVYPQYFIDALETAGGIAWSGSWRTTEAGAAHVPD